MATLMPILAALQCPTNFIRLSSGVQCFSNEFCASLAAGFTCERNVCCSRAYRDSSCPSDHVSIDGVCYSMVSVNEPCAFSQQCRGGGRCTQGICRSDGEIIGSCRNPNDVIERNLQTQQIKNCLEEPCSQGFTCEYTMAGVYQCCGLYSNSGNYDYGSVKMYPGTNLPLVCEAINSCLFVDTPNCVYSSRYRCKVCCSTWNC